MTIDIKEINERTQFRYCVHALDGKSDPDAFKRRILDAHKCTKTLIQTMEFRNVELTNERRIIMMGEILTLVSDGLHLPNPIQAEDNAVFPIIEVFEMESERIIKSALYYYYYWALLIKSTIIKQLFNIKIII